MLVDLHTILSAYTTGDIDRHEAEFELERLGVEWFDAQVELDEVDRMNAKDD